MPRLLTLLALLTCISLQAQDDPAKQEEATAVGTNGSFTGYTVFFETGSTVIRSNFETDLAALAPQINETGRRVAITGFTDNVGQPDANLELSRRRAEAVQQFLIESGADSVEFDLAFSGEDQPVGDNETASGRAQNRRVEISYATAEEEPTLSEDIYEEEAADELITNITPPEGSRLIEREFPNVQATNNLSFNALQKRFTSSNGATVMVPFRYNSGDSRPQRAILTTKGATSFYVIPLSVTSSEGILRIPLSMSTQLGEGGFEVVASLVNADNEISQPDTVLILMERLGTGRLQISLSWDTNTDQDIHVFTPSDGHIFWRSRFGDNGGQLDRDDRDGQGPENIFWETEAPDGIYRVEVKDFWGTSTPNNFVITFNGLGTSKQFFGTTQEGEQVQVFRFKKEGDTVEFLED
ncbi:MAG: OmpA family protein [Bacteroidota bacterium]